MTLLIFLPSEKLEPQYEELLKPTLRREVASKVSEAILTSMGTRGEARMRQLVRLRLWAEAKARDAEKELPPSLPLGLQSADDMTSSHSNGNGDDIMVQ